MALIIAIELCYWMCSKEGAVSTMEQVNLWVKKFGKELSIFLSVSTTQKSTPAKGRERRKKNSFTHLDLAGHRSCHSHFWTSPRGELTIKHDNLADLRILERLGKKLFQQIFFGANIRSTPNMPPFIFVRKPAVYDSVAIYQVLKLSAQKIT